MTATIPKVQPYAKRGVPVPSGSPTLAEWASTLAGWLGIEFGNVQRGLNIYPASKAETGVVDVTIPHGNARRYGAETTGDNTVYLRNMLLSAVALGIEAITDIQVPCSKKLTFPSGTRHTHTLGGAWVFDWELASGQGGSSYFENDDTVTGDSDVILTNLTLKGPWPDDGGPFGQGRVVNGVLVAPVTGFHPRRVDGLQVNGCNITNIPGIAFGYQGVKNFKFSNLYISRCGRDGLTGWWFGTGWNLQNGLISNVFCDRVGDDGLAIHASSGGLPNTDTRPTGIQINGVRVQGWTNTVTSSATVAMTAASKTVTATASVFTSADVGKTFYVPGAGAAGAALATYVLSYISGTQLHLGVTASTTVSGAAAVYSFGAGRGLILDGVADVQVNDLFVDTTFAQGVAITSDGVAGSSGFRSQRVTVKGKVVRAGTLGNASQPQSGLYESAVDYIDTDLDVSLSAGKGMYVTDALGPKLRGSAIGNGTLITDYGVDLDGVVSASSNVINADVDVRSAANKGGGIRTHYAPFCRVNGEYVDNGQAQAGGGTDTNGSGILHNGDHTMILGPVVSRDTRVSAASRTQTSPLAVQNAGGVPVIIIDPGAFQTAVSGSNINIANPNAVVIRRGAYDQSPANARLAFDQDLSGFRKYSGTGSPEGVVTSGVGNVYDRTDGAAGTWRYVKATGAGNTGWVAVY